MQAAWKNWIGRCRLTTASRLKNVHGSSLSINNFINRSTASQFSTLASHRPAFHLYRNELATLGQPSITIASRSYARRKRGASIDLNTCRNIDEVLQLAVENLNGLTPSTTAAVWSYLSRLLASRQRPQLDRVAMQAAQGSIIYEQQISAILDHTTNLVDRFNPKQLSTITLSVAKIVRSIREAHQKKRGSVYHLAFGKVLSRNNSNQEQNIFRALSQAANGKINKFEPRQLSNFMYALALFKYNPIINGKSTLLETFGNASIDCIDQFEPQGLSNTVWAYSTLKVSHPVLFQTVGDRIVHMPDLNDFVPQDLSNIVWAYTTLKVQHLGMFQKIGDQIVESDNLKSFKPQAFANTVWAYATLNVQHPELFKKIGDHIVVSDNLESFKPQGFANIVWAYATLNVQHHGIFQKIGDHIAASDDLNSFKPQNLANIVWAYAAANIEHPGMFQNIAVGIVERHDLKSFNSQNLSNLAWSYSVANISAHSLFDDIFINELLDRQNEFGIKELCQLHQWHIWQTGLKLGPGLPKMLEQRCHQAFIKSSS